MRWTPSQYLHWFDEYVVTDEAAAKVRSVAIRFGLRDLEGELLTTWYARVARTMRNKDERFETAADIASVDAAIAYAYVALRSCAHDVLRATARDPLPFDPGTPPSEAEIPEPPVDDDLFDAVSRRLFDMMKGRPGGRFGCPGHRCVQIALAVIEVALGRTPAATTVADVTGGTDEWDRLVYRAIELLWPERAGRAADARERQLKSRCGRCARDVLQGIVDEGGSPVGVR